MRLKETHKAIVNATSLYADSQFTIRDVTNYSPRVLKLSTNVKLGKIVKRGKHKGKRKVNVRYRVDRNLTFLFFWIYEPAEKEKEYWW